ncbi:MULTISPECIES: hypothetical protein [Asaia]|uniref:Uncharacterized protein n=1 Tax=Asaia bogorensis TaxID=91915 RepID=A0A060QIF5_9PROT|nr:MULTISPECIES: hypothetical protein [Asaia]CDG38562.1 hypothetical protein ASAP_0517 [Asaia bogorensis]
MPRPAIMTPEREAATVLMRRMRAQRGGAEKIAAKLSLDPCTVKGCELLPACHLRRFVACFGNHPPSHKSARSLQPEPVERIDRKCLCCGAWFTAKGRWLRLCQPCRERC